VESTLLVEHGLPHLPTSRTLVIERSIAVLRVVCAGANATLRWSTAVHLFVAVLVAVIAQVRVVRSLELAAECSRGSERISKVKPALGTPAIV
jgi:hypothetical protein